MTSVVREGPGVDAGGPRRIRSVGAIVVHRGRLLLIQRGHAPAKGQWSVPGGKVEPGESDREAVVREVHEETGLRVRVGELAGTVEREGSNGVIFDIYDYDAVLVDEARAGVDDAGAGVNEGGAGVDAAGYDAVRSGEGFPGADGHEGYWPGRAASDAAGLCWLSLAELAADDPPLPLTDGLVAALRSWGRIP